MKCKLVTIFMFVNSISQLLLCLLKEFCIFRIWMHPIGNYSFDPNAGCVVQDL